MSLALAIRLTEILLGFALIQRSLEHLYAQAGEPIFFVANLLFCALLVGGVAPGIMVGALLVNGALLLRRFQGPYNGGADRMGLLILMCLALAHLAPSEKSRALAFGYLGAQVALSYFVSGWVKIVNSDWRSGQALQDVLAFSAYPAGENLRGWADRPRALQAASWAAMGFELAFPLSLASAPTLDAALALGAAFHLANACLFGLNRFFWTWLCAYPSLLWLQTRLV